MNIPSICIQSLYFVWFSYQQGLSTVPYIITVTLSNISVENNNTIPHALEVYTSKFPTVTAL